MSRPERTQGVTGWQRRYLEQTLNIWRGSDFDPYVIFGLSRPVSQEQITVAYRRLVKEFHPDLHFNDEVAIELLKRINIARDTLNASNQYSHSSEDYSQDTVDYDTEATHYSQHNETQNPNWDRNQQTDEQYYRHRYDRNSHENLDETKQKRQSAGLIKSIFCAIIWAITTLLLVAIVIDTFDDYSLTLNNYSLTLSDYSLTLSNNRLTSSNQDTSKESITSQVSDSSDEEIVRDINISNIEASRQYALSIINQIRTDAGMKELTLIDISASQKHAEDMRDNCFISPWGTDGMKPYMRYTLSGSEQHSSESIIGSNYCPTFGFIYGHEVIEAKIKDAIVSKSELYQIDSSILDPNIQGVSIGIAYDQPNLWLVMTFVNDYIEYQLKPFIHNHILQFSITRKHDIDLFDEDPIVLVYYDPLPKELTRGQLHQTDCYSYGEFVAVILEPLGPGVHYDNETLAFPSQQCVDPYQLPADSPTVSSYDEMSINEMTIPRPVEIQEEGIIITADTWEMDFNELYVKADLSILLSLLSDGVYTIRLLAYIDDELVPISTYSIFHSSHIDS